MQTCRRGTSPRARPRSNRGALVGIDAIWRLLLQNAEVRLSVCVRKKGRKEDVIHAPSAQRKGGRV